MGYRVAEAAWERGADVVLISGPVALAAADRRHGPPGRDHRGARGGGARGAPGRRRAGHGGGAGRLPAQRPERQQARRATTARSRSRWSPPVDILSATRGERRPGSVIVGFALETGDALAKGRAKLERKDLDLIVVNDALEPGAGFEVDTNRVALLGRDGARADPAAAVEARRGRGHPRRRGAQPWPMNGALSCAADRARRGRGDPRRPPRRRSRRIDAHRSLFQRRASTTRTPPPRPPPYRAPHPRGPSPSGRRARRRFRARDSRCCRPRQCSSATTSARWTRSRPWPSGSAPPTAASCAPTAPTPCRARAIRRRALVLVGEGPGRHRGRDGPAVRRAGGTAARHDSRGY